MIVNRSVEIKTIALEEAACWPDGSPGAVTFRWLGQAGFAVRGRDFNILIDPYLSDHLAVKYKDARFKHQRMMPAPVNYADIRDLSLVMCSHRHSDHMDPDALPVLCRNNPSSKFIVPAAVTDRTLELGILRERIVPVTDGDTVKFGDRVCIRVIPSAHEDLQTDEHGNHLFLGFIIELEGIKLYHSGDCIPYDGLTGRLACEQIDIAMLPVNGRDEERASANVPGNFTVDEALSLCESAHIPVMVAHHFGMFSFNTVETADIAEQSLSRSVECIVPEPYTAYSAAIRQSRFDG